MKLLPYLLLLLVVVAASSHATSNSLTTLWSSRLPGVLMPASIKEYLSAIDDETIASRFVTNNPNISEDINIVKCHATTKPPEMMKIDDTTSISLHFLEKDLSNIKNVILYPRFPNLQFGNGHFILRSEVERFPALKSTNLPIILTRFSISSNSRVSKVIKNTIELCEYATKDDNVCITSLESMIDFVQSTLVNKSNSLHDRVIRAFSTTMQAKYFSPRSYLQPYRIVQVMRLSNLKDANSTVTCHKAEFPFAVFLCHQRPTTVPYVVTLEGVDDKTKIEASTVCHMDTSEWHPSFPGLVALKATPGTPICHFLNQRGVLWVVGGN